MLLQFLNEALITIIAFAIGLSIYRKLNTFYRLLFYQLLIYILSFLIAYAITKYQKHYGLPRNNHWIYNLNIFIETSLLSMAAYKYLESKFEKLLAIGLILLFNMTFFFLIYKYGVHYFSQWSYAIESLVVVALYILVLHRFFINHAASPFSDPLLWVATGLIIYFGCNLPYFSMFNYLNYHHPKTSEMLFLIITNVLANVRYLFLAIAFWQIKKRRPAAVKI